MVKITDPDASKGYLPRVRGTFLSYAVDDRTYVRAWPKKDGRPNSPGKWYSQTEFGIAARMAAHVLAIDLETAKNMVNGTSMVPRDFLMTCIMGTAYEFTDGPNGEHLESARLAQNPQYILDAVTNTPGDILVRTDVGWLGLGAGQIGQFLTMAPNGLPAWIDAGAELQYTSGPWTPVVTAETTPATGQAYTLRTAWYLHLTQAKTCLVTAIVQLSNKGTSGVGNAIITGLPKTLDATKATRVPLTTTLLGPAYGTGRTGANAAVFDTPSCLRFDLIGSGVGGLYLPWSSITNTTLIVVQGMYPTT